MKLELRGISKSFDENRVLRDINLDLYGGEVVALVGENGAGKSTLTRIISGVYSPDVGTIAIDNAEVRFHRPQDAMNAGIHVIYQEFAQNLFPSLDVATNLFPLDSGHHFGRAFVNRAARRQAARNLLSALNLSVDPDAIVDTLRVGDQQMVAVARAIGQEVRLLILDEPTASLDQDQSEELFTHIVELRERGVAILYISHRLPEVFAMANRIIVLRDGIVSATGTPDELSERDVVAAMVGRSIDQFYPKEDHRSDELLLRVEDLSAPGFHDVSIELRRGEILGIAGVLGSGKDEVLRTLYGLLPITSGTITLCKQPASLRSAADALQLGIAYVTLDRQGEGLGLQRTIRENMTMSSLGAFTRAGFIQRTKEAACAKANAERMHLRSNSIEQSVDTLSGGNQQKVLLGRSTLRAPDVLLLHEPTRGVDVAAKTEIYHIMNEQTARGAGIIMVSSDLPELVEMSDRVIVMRDGAPAGELTGQTLTQQNVLDLSLIGATHEN